MSNLRSFLLDRSLALPTTRPPTPYTTHPLLHLLSVSPVLRTQILLGFVPSTPLLLAVTTSNALVLWELDPLLRVNLHAHLELDTENYLPLSCVSAGLHRGELVQASYRSEGEEGILHVSRVKLDGLQVLSTSFERVTAEDSSFGGICFNGLDQGYVVVSTSTRVYFFCDAKDMWCSGVQWNLGDGCVILEVDEVVSRWTGFVPTRYVTRIRCVQRGTTYVLVHAMRDKLLRTFILDVCFQGRKVAISRRSKILNLGETRVKDNFQRIWDTVIGHDCATECSPHANSVTVFHSYFPQHEKDSINTLICDYTHVIIQSKSH
jgi:hypothetical protein